MIDQKSILSWDNHLFLTSLTRSALSISFQYWPSRNSISWSVVITSTNLVLVALVSYFITCWRIVRIIYDCNCINLNDHLLFLISILDRTWSDCIIWIEENLIIFQIFSSMNMNHNIFWFFVYEFQISKIVSRWL